jgi:ClpP class serine protease
LGRRKRSLLRQLLIRDIQAETRHTLLVYFAVVTDARAQIMAGDDAYFLEMLRDAKGGAVDLMIETQGGFTDPTEKIASVLRTLGPNLRVIASSTAKSNGTMLALVGSNVITVQAASWDQLTHLFIFRRSNRFRLIF